MIFNQRYNYTYSFLYMILFFNFVYVLLVSMFKCSNILLGFNVLFKIPNKI